jgi:hypothetical protein
LSELVEGVYPLDGRLPVLGLDPVEGWVDGRDPVEGRVEGCVPVDGRVDGWVPVDGRLPALGVSVFDQPLLSRRSQLPLSFRR